MEICRKGLNVDQRPASIKPKDKTTPSPISHNNYTTATNTLTHTELTTDNSYHTVSLRSLNFDCSVRSHSGLLR